MGERRTRDIDFVFEQFGKMKNAMAANEDFDVPSKLAAGGFLAYCNVASASGEVVRVPINGLQSGEFGPRRVRDRIVDCNGVPVLSWTELIRMKIKSYASRMVERDLDDIKYCLRNHGDELKTDRLEDVVDDNYDSWWRFITVANR